ncbi:hypothetical protein PR048_024830 [Dryococelus australis]|uniref:Fucosyltransferase n=1 Tax=Dryococelus australis TaxID=614101 RepID=A0ABQ9GPN6_9NEOP|nr:hypothetical protein PR048_024830 [Dryococelus australis]
MDGWAAILSFLAATALYVLLAAWHTEIHAPSADREIVKKRTAGVTSQARTTPVVTEPLHKPGSAASPATPKQALKKILFWNRYFDSEDYAFGVGRKPFLRSGCPIDKCYVVSRNYGWINTDDFDAIIIHGWELLANSKDLKSLSASRRPHQRYVLFLLEAPGVYITNFEKFPNFFNWTMTYRLDSDVYRPYGYFVPTNNNSSEYVDVRRTLDVPWKVQDNILAPVPSNKTGLVAWLVSKCKTPSQRESYVKELGKYIKVDVYGKCGPLNCAGRMSEECYRMLDRKYKFYLSFENSLCRDYVTEKLFAVMQYRVVPIVYGGADYKTIAPPGSYIDTRDFASPKDLAEYLKRLDANPDEYNEYFRWKESYRVNRRPMSHAMCKLCEILNDPLQPPKSYASMQEWYSGPSVCHRASSHWKKN